MTSGAPAAHQKHQGGNRPAEEPSAGRQARAVRKSKAAAEAVQSAGGTLESTDETFPESTDGTSYQSRPAVGPGDAIAATTSTASTASTAATAPTSATTSTAPTVATIAPGAPNPKPATKTPAAKTPAAKTPHDEDENKGDGTKYEKSTGMAADGGDFDATRPGAGREADRLLEEKGIHRDVPSHPSGTDDSASPAADAGAGKHGMASKAKEKLHLK